MAYEIKTSLGASLTNATINTTLTLSDSIEREVEESVEIEIQATGGAGDSDSLEVYQFNSMDNVKYEDSTNGRLLGVMTLNSDTEVVKHFTLQKKSPFFKIGINMTTGSSETPTVNGFYQKDQVSLS